MGDDGFVMAESVAILRYLARERKVADHWYPSDSMKQFRVDEYLEWQHLTARRLCMAFFQAKFLLPMVNNTPANETEVEKAFQAMLPCLKQRKRSGWTTVKRSSSSATKSPWPTSCL